MAPGSPGSITDRADWTFWLVLAGRGFGKTRLGAETVREWAKDPTQRILMIAPTASDVRDVMIEGPSGIMSCFPARERPTYLPTRRLMLFPSGAVGIMRSADEPERLRGPQFTSFWADELCAWRYSDEAWSQIMFGFRLQAEQPLRGVITTTPKPIKVLKNLLANPATVVTRGSSYDNRANLSNIYFDTVIAPFEGTRLGRQEIEAEVLEDTPGALWTQHIIDATRITAGEIQWDKVVRVVVGVDPAVTAAENSDETGIVVAALVRSGHVLILDDLSLRDTPLAWARVVAAAYRSRGCDRVVAEVNNGGDLVEANLRTVAPTIPYRSVRASRGKTRRAEPVAALYEQGRVHHVGTFSALESQMTTYVPGDEGGKNSPDRMDALVWAVWELLLDKEPITQIAIRPIEQISPF